MKLANLDQYRQTFLDNGVVCPLPKVPVAGKDLLHKLPKPPSSKSGWPWTEQVSAAAYQNRLDWPKLTIVTPSYNQVAYLEQTIRAVLLQNYPNLEYIIMDGGSNDGSKEILKKYSPWISYWQSKKDNGQSHAINQGFSLASGKYYAWINSDDYYLPDTFALVISTFEESGTEFIYGYACNVKQPQAKVEVVKVPPLLDYFIKIPTLAQPSCFWSAAIHQPVWEEMHCALDYELWLRMVTGKKRRRLKQVLAAANIHDEAKTFNPAMKAKWNEDNAKMWSTEGHGPVPEWNRLVFLNRLRMKLYKLFKFV